MPYKDPEKHRAAQRRYEKKRVRPPERKEWHKKYRKEYYKQPEVKKRRKEYHKEYEKRPERRAYHKDYRSKYKKRAYQLRKNNPAGKRGRYLRAKVRQAVIHQRCYTSTIHKLIGCDVPTARAQLEAQFEPWMNWENYGSGKGKWTIDHIIRVSSIDIFDEDEVKRIFHYTNMRPLCFIKNSENTDEGR